MKILLVSSYLPYPLTNGGNIRLYNLIAQLKTKHEITLVCEKRDYQTASDIAQVEKICEKVVTVKRHKQWSIQNLLKALLTPLPFLVIGHTSREFQDAISVELEKGIYDIVHVETFYVMQNIPDFSIPIVLIEHNIEYSVYAKFVDKTPFFLRPLLQIDIKKLKRIEEAFWAQATAIGAVSRQEKSVINRENCFVIENGVNLNQFKKKKIADEFINKLKTVLYIGDFAWIQNRDAVSYILSKVWPKIQDKNINLWIVGRNMPASLKKLAGNDDRILMDDNNKDSAEVIFEKADVLFAPIRVGGGTSYKIIESMAVGTPVITTSLGLEGIDVIKDKDILVSDTPEEQAEMLVQLLKDSKRYKDLSKNGREAIEKVYDWPIIAKKLDELYTFAKNTYENRN